MELIHSIEFQMSFLLFIALGGYLLASKVHQSAVIGEILVGLIVGPSILGLITYTDFVSSIAHLGAVILLFVVGMEFRLKDIANIKYAIIALLGVLVPWVFGYYFTRAFGYSFTCAVFVGTALTATSIAITANVLKEMGKLHTAVGQAIIGAAVIDDVLGLIVLSFSHGIATGTFSFMSTFLIIIKAVLFLGIGSLLGHFVIRKFVIAIDKTKYAGEYPEMTFIFAMMCAFFYGMAAEAIGLSAIIGAFIAGASLGGVKLKKSHNIREGSEYLQVIFAAIFFVSLGILADAKALRWGVVLFILLLTLVALLSKLIGCGFAAKIQGMNWRESALVGYGMVPRGEVAMIVALIGLDKKLITQDIYVALIIMSLLTTIITPFFLKNWKGIKTIKV